MKYTYRSIECEHFLVTLLTASNTITSLLEKVREIFPGLQRQKQHFEPSLQRQRQNLDLLIAKAEAALKPHDCKDKGRTWTRCLQR
jgi:hypothetical protein